MAQACSAPFPLLCNGRVSAATSRNSWASRGHVSKRGWCSCHLPATSQLWISLEGAFRVSLEAKPSGSERGSPAMAQAPLNVYLCRFGACRFGLGLQIRVQKERIKEHGGKVSCKPGLLKTTAAKPRPLLDEPQVREAAGELYCQTGGWKRACCVTTPSAK